MKKSTVLFSLSALLLALAGCENYDEMDPQAGKLLPVSIVGTVEATPDDAESRSIYDDLSEDPSTYTGIGTSDYFWPGWVPGDTLGAFDNEHSNVSFGYDTKKGYFVGSIGESMRLVYNYYPYRKGTFEPTAVPATIAKVQNYDADDTCYYHKFDIYAGEPRYVGNTEGTEAYGVTMCRPTCLLQVYIDFSGIDSIKNDEITKIRYEASTPLSGEYTMDITDKYPVLQPVDGMTSNHINVNFPQPKKLTEPISAWLVVAPTVECGHNVKLVVTTDKHRININTKVLHKFQAGNRLNLVSIFDTKTLTRDDNTVTIECVTPSMLTIAASSDVVVSE